MDRIIQMALTLVILVGVAAALDTEYARPEVPGWSVERAPGVWGGWIMTEDLPIEFVVTPGVSVALPLAFLVPGMFSPPGEVWAGWSIITLLRGEWEWCGVIG